MGKTHILLLPRSDYFKWVRAAQKYALHFGVGITPDPAKVGEKDVVTIALPPNGYPQEGDIALWLEQHFPDVQLDVIEVDTPDSFAELMAERVTKDRPYMSLAGGKSGQDVVGRIPKDRLYLFWPTDYPTILQPFGANPELYVPYGLPGHEGVDIRAPYRTNIYACADGEVYLVEDGHNEHNYGKQVRIRHPQGYRTIYAHLDEVLVSVGDQVKARHLIGRADSTGNSTGNHLHLTLKKDHASANGETDYPLDIIDPTPYLVYKHQEAGVLVALGLSAETGTLESYPWTQPCLIGVNGREGGSMQEVDFSALEQARIEAVQISAQTPSSTIARLRQINPDMFLLAGMQAAQTNAVLTPQAWVDELHSAFHNFYNLGIRYFQIHQMPNLQQFGWRKSWTSGESFGNWWLRVVALLKAEFPEARLGFPGVSGGGHVPGQRLDAEVFLDGADRAMFRADWIGVNCYWSSEAEMNTPSHGKFYTLLRERYPNKLLFITGFGNINAFTNPIVKGREYVKYYQQLRTTPGVGAAFAQLISSSGGYPALVWRTEDGAPTAIVSQVGGREF